MVVKQVPYNPPTRYLYLDQKRKMEIAKRIQKQIAKFDIRLEEIEVVNSLFFFVFLTLIRILERVYYKYYTLVKANGRIK
jgi:hypothetical protein